MANSSIPNPQTLFHPETNAAMVARIQALPVDASARWGKMTASQMMAHCGVPILMHFGRVKATRSFIGRLFGRIAKKSLLGSAPFRHSLPTDKRFLINHAPNFAIERDKLVEAVKLFVSPGRAGLSSEPHPFFGPMSFDEIEILQRKHLNHHLGQFGG